MYKAGSKGLEVAVKDLLPGCGEGGKRPPVEAVFERQDGIAVAALSVSRILSCCLDGGLVCLRPGIGEKDRRKGILSVR